MNQICNVILKYQHDINMKKILMNRNSVNLLPSIIIAWNFFLNYGTYVFYKFFLSNKCDRYI